MKKIIAAAAALALSAGAVSCGKKSASSGTDDEKNSAVSYTAYNAADIEMGGDFSHICTLTGDTKSGDILIFGQSGGESWHGYVTDGNFSDRTDFRFYPAENETVLSAAMLGFGKNAVLTCLDGNTFIHILGSDGAVEKLIDCGEILTAGEDGNIYGQLFRSGDGFAISDHENNVHFISAGGENLGEPDLGGRTVMGVSGNSGGTLTLLLLEADNSLCMADYEGTSLVNLRPCNAPASSALTMCCGFGKTEFAAVFMDGLYAFRDGDWTKLSDLAALDFHASEISGLVMTGEQEFTAAVGKSSLSLLSKEDISDLKAKKVVTLAVYEGRADNYLKLADDYNKAHPDSGYRIEVQQYITDDTTNYDQMMDNMKMDILTGDAPDIVVDRIDGLDPSVYYVDLMEYLQNDPDLGTDDFVPGFLDSITIDGTIPTIYPNFQVSTLIGKTRFVGENENWSYDDFIAAYESMPEDMELKDLTTGKLTDTFMYLMNIEEFVDYNSGSCSFDSTDFIRMMEFVKDNHIGLTQVEWDKLYGGQSLVFWDEDPLRFRNNKTLLAEGFQHPTDIVEKLHAAFDEDVTFVGYPTLNGEGGYIISPDISFSILKTSEYPDIAWDFIKLSFDDKYYGDHTYHGFPTLEEKFVECFGDCMDVHHYDGETKVPQGTYYYDYENGKFILYDSFTQAETDRAMAYVRACVKNFRRYDNDLDEIIREELEEYFNSDKSADSAAAMIQNRAAIYLSETYG